MFAIFRAQATTRYFHTATVLACVPYVVRYGQPLPVLPIDCGTVILPVFVVQYGRPNCKGMGEVCILEVVICKVSCEVFSARHG